ncbi:hypothetical protein L1C56_03955 [Klebsiella pneumoniae]|uniref:hypothetical protein n=1 Tax=Klebsiella pneumoniae TaxID=573 RepID=UPI0005B3F426|nr:hypothetical protein [Klebsiella pneumoniae]MBD7783995.1 hypothetical protein [Klebsiella pneumoniae]MBG2002325.1 hypothetical protein [Klebsiella pneumoniae]MBG2065327.1 hypothetical protein [Klebsiella pneumoniae]MBG2082234.1 hypothetical protein [Klebsiella pneumoniae]MCQ0846668.1 hypothetical protein [Klebsiella pneumoniae]
MTKSTITREQLEEWVAQFDEDGGCDATDSQLEALIRQSLAAMDGEPVAEVLSNRPGNDTSTIDRALPVGTKLYRHAQPASVVPVSQKEPISFDEWSRKCALQITLCYSDFREKAKYIWDSARETQHVAPVLVDDVSIFEAAIEECKTCDSIDEHAWNHGVLAVIAKYESCRAAMLNGGKP